MSEELNKNTQSSQDKPVRRKEMSRRQFLNYTLGGTGGFMLGLPISYMLRFSVDPLLQPKGKGDFVKVVEASQITSTPKSFKFKKHQVDGWYESDPDFEAWIIKDDEGKIYALSPICKHLGCTVNWNTEPDTSPNQFVCPCHGAHYTKDGKNLVVAPAPLDEYQVKIDNGYVYLGPVIPNSRV
ncbi:MAG TPA: ubiquinol-cytochrome c reductase iron-sulfur subunit [Bacilli bacterium]